MKGDCRYFVNRFAISIIFTLFSSVLLKAQDYDFRIIKKITLDRNRDHDASMYFLSQTADPVAIVAPLAVFGTGVVTKNEELTKNGKVAILGTLGAYSAAYVLKKTVNRPRPYQTYPTIQHYRNDEDSSFPSGTTTAAFAAATSLTVSLKKWYVAVPAYAWAAGVGYSRMHLGAHYPSDVLAGAVLGTGSVILSRKLNHWINKPSAKKSPAN